MRESWDIKSLGELADIKGGKRVPKGYKLLTEPTNYPYIRVTDFNDNGSVDMSDIHYVNEDVFKQIKNYTISKKDLYISIAGTIGKTGIIPEELDGSNLTENACKLIFKEDIEPRFIYYFTKSDDFLRQAGLNTRTAAMPKLALNRLSTINLFIPASLIEQQRIVAILDEAFASIANAKVNAEQNLKNAKKLFESYLQRVFENKGKGWEEKRFDEICILQRGFDLPTHSRVQGKYPLVSSNGITDRISLWKIKSPGVVTGRSGTIGNVHFVEEDFWPLNTALYIKNFHGNYERFIYYFLKHFDLSQFSSGAGVPTLNRNNVHGEMVYFPTSVNEQRSIVAKLDAILNETKKLEAIYQQKLNDLEELKKSLLQKVFNGELKTA